jgi:hypothetical protein
VAVAIKDFRYWDRARQESVQIRAGDQVDADTLARHGVDLEKLGRVKFLDLDTGEGAERPREVVRKRGRPKKQTE